MNRLSTLEGMLRRDRAVVMAGLAGITALAWVYLFVEAARMDGMAAMATARVAPWSALDFVLMFVMWAVMMVAMMVPSAAPMILLYAVIARKQREKCSDFAPVGVFATGYLAVWSAFSLAATGLQWLLEQAALLSPAMVSRSPILGGVLLIVAGIYQLTPLKQACLRHCRSPVHFLTSHWHKGRGGAFVMGLEHGAYCVGCCWFLMGLLFVGGVMNLLWVAAIAVFVLVEKVLPFGVLTGRISGGLFVAAGLLFLLQA